ncbi:MAG: hypothetical protein ACETWE_03395 [Candidatus Bathyarchaeia archaeon]
MTKGKVKADMAELDSFLDQYVIDERDRETVLRKSAMVRRCLPLESVIDFGGMWEVDGLYSRLCKGELGIPRVMMVDRIESENWQRNPRLRTGIDFRKGDFSDDKFMATIKEPYDLALA